MNDIPQEYLVDELKKFYATDSLEGIIWAQHKQILKLQGQIKKAGLWTETPIRTRRK